MKMDTEDLLLLLQRTSLYLPPIWARAYGEKLHEVCPLYTKGRTSKRVVMQEKAV